MDARRLAGPHWGLIVCFGLLSLVVTNSARAQYGPSAPTSVVLAPMPQRLQPVPVVSGMPTAGMIPMASSRSPAARVATPGAGQSANFIVLCNDPQLTPAVSEAAERLRRELAVHWLGHELPNWSQRIPLRVTSGSTLGAGGETVFTLYNGNVGNWSMSVQGTPERILDSVLPHEITHTIFASHFAPLNTHVPRWADEGACTTVEDDSEQNKHRKFLVQFLRSGRGLAFNRMFSLKDYPQDMLPLYAQGHAVAEFLIAQGGPRKFVTFLEDGMKSQRWNTALEKSYGYSSLGELQTKWNLWIADGRGAVDAYVAKPTSASSIASVATSQPRSGSVDLVSADMARPDAGSSTTAASSTDKSSELIPEGVSVGLPLVALAATTYLPAESTTKPSQEVNLVARDANTLAPTTPQDQSAASGFFRQRLEGNLRDIVRTEPASPSAISTSAAVPQASSSAGNLAGPRSNQTMIDIQPAPEIPSLQVQPSMLADVPIHSALLR